MKISAASAEEGENARAGLGIVCAVDSLEREVGAAAG
jgi:hypothetical protein